MLHCLHLPSPPTSVDLFANVLTVRHLWRFISSRQEKIDGQRLHVRINESGPLVIEMFVIANIEAVPLQWLAYTYVEGEGGGIFDSRLLQLLFFFSLLRDGVRCVV